MVLQRCFSGTVSALQLKKLISLCLGICLKWILFFLIFWDLSNGIGSTSRNKKSWPNFMNDVYKIAQNHQASVFDWITNFPGAINLTLRLPSPKMVLVKDNSIRGCVGYSNFLLLPMRVKIKQSKNIYLSNKFVWTNSIH